MSKIPPTFENNGGGQFVPPDLVWDENNHPMIYPCSQAIEHHPNCPFNREEDAIEIDSELQVELLNEARKYARVGMSFMGVPAAYQGAIPVPGIGIELVDLLTWLQAVKQIIMDNLDVTEFELDEMYRAKKLTLLQEIRLANEERIKQQRLRSQLSIAQKPGLLGPDGQPL